MAAPVIAEIVRSGFVEGHHYGSVVALGRAGDVAWSVGAVDVPVLPRSCNKPLQALAMVRHARRTGAPRLIASCPFDTASEYRRMASAISAMPSWPAAATWRVPFWDAWK